jgi:glucose/arabinose dehydrogenase
MRTLTLTTAALALTACAATEAADDTTPLAMNSGATTQAMTQAAANEPIARPFEVRALAQLDQPWAMTFLPDGRMLVTEKIGELHLVTQAGEVSAPIAGVPRVDDCGQGGLGDVALHPDYQENGIVYLTYTEPGEGDERGGAMGRGRLDLDEMRIEGFETIWRQSEKVTGCGHYSFKMAFSPDGEHLFLSSGERQKKEPAQDLSSNLGAILRLTLDGEAAAGNPFADRGSPTDQIWSYGHRNALGLVFAPDGRLYENEMGPKGGDEFQLIERGENYGWPVVSNGDNYDGSDIPEHDTRPEFRAPDEYWNPVISPSAMIWYTGDAFPGWTGSPLITGLNSKALVRVTMDCPWQGREVCEAERWVFDNRLREVEQGPDGTVFILEDEKDGAGGQLLHLVPAG